jgi:hypothetical protein
VIAFLAILFTGRYLRGLFDFNVGRMRWGGVGFHSSNAVGTNWWLVTPPRYLVAGVVAGNAPDPELADRRSATHINRLKGPPTSKLSTTSGDLV